MPNYIECVFEIRQNKAKKTISTIYNTTKRHRGFIIV